MKGFFDWGLEDVFGDIFRRETLYFLGLQDPNGFKRDLGWRIDYILATAPLAEKSRKVRVDRSARALSKPSDHTFLVAEFEL